MTDITVVNDLVTVRDYLRWATSCYNEEGLVFGHGTDNAWDDAVHLLCYALHLPIGTRDILDAHLTIWERQRLVSLIEERINTRKPVAYLTHRAWFAGLEFYVDERVLVPRSPIAELIEQHFVPWVPAFPDKILDLCTGSACIAVACAMTFTDAQVDAVDNDSNALEVAKRNVEHYGLQDQVQLIQSDLFTALGDKQYDVIVTNPPYVSEKEIAGLAPEFQHEPKQGFYGEGQDGLAIVQKILQQAAQYLTPQGILVCEVGNSEASLMTRYPRVPFTWVEFERGGHGVFVLTRDQLMEFQSQW